MSDGLLLTIVGVWLAVQLTKGQALQRMNLVTP